MPDVGDIPVNVSESTSKLGWLLGGYLQDEWKLTRVLTLNFGIRFDQMYQFVDANQWSPRVSLIYKPFDGTTLHAGYARYFTPPSQVIATPTNVAAFDNTSQASQNLRWAISGRAAALRSRAPRALALLRRWHRAADLSSASRSVSTATTRSRAICSMTDNSAPRSCSTGSTMRRRTTQGIELKADYNVGNLRAYGNIAIAQQKGTDIVSNQFLIDPGDLAYIANHYIFTDHSQTVTASAGISYLLWQKTRLSADMIYGSGLRTNSPDGVPNGSHVPGYAQVNIGMSHEFQDGMEKPATIRFDIINLFDKVYEIRDGSGIGVFAPQFGPRREFLVGLSQKF